MEGVAVGEGPGRRMWAVWARDSQGLRWDSEGGGECGGGAFQRFEEVKIVKTQWSPGYKERAESEMPSCF